MADDQRSDDAKQWQWIYSSARWLRLRQQVWVRDKGLCRYCGKLIIGTFHCDHIKAHKGDEQLMWDIKNLQLLHPHCHNSIKQSFEHTGFIKGCDVNGSPVDPTHPWSRGARSR